VTDRSLLTELCEGAAQHLVGAVFGRDLMSAGSSSPPSLVDVFFELTLNIGVYYICMCVRIHILHEGLNIFLHIYLN
jgi:hypothetical protein